MQSLIRRGSRFMPGCLPAVLSGLGVHGKLHSIPVSDSNTSDPPEEPAVPPLAPRTDALSRALFQEMGKINDAGTRKVERVITSPQGMFVEVEGVEKPVLNFCSNNYLGLSNHPKLVEAAHATLDSHGYGMSSVRFICGTQNIHKQLEEKISAFHGTEDTILYPSCFDANAGLFEALLTEQDAVISDALNHASIIDGIRLCKARRVRYSHINMDSLEMKLKECKDNRLRLIATDGVFSMDGDIAPLDEICELAKRYDAIVFVDDCHATGVLGETGRGTEEHFKMKGEVDIINSTLGKALGGATGGYTTGRADVIEILRQKSRPYLFSNSLAPPIVGAGLAAFELLENDTSLLANLQRQTSFFRSQILNAGFRSRTGCTSIIPIMLGDAGLANEFAKELFLEGIYVTGFSYPVVPMDSARIRVQVSASFSQEDITRALEAFEKVSKKLHLLKTNFGAGSGAVIPQQKGFPLEWEK